MRWILLLFLPALSMAASSPYPIRPSYICEDIGVAHFVNSINLSQGIKADPRYVYSLRGIMVLQKLKGGYLFGVYAPDDGESYDVGYLQTTRSLGENDIFFEGEALAVPIGDYHYTAANGFDRNIPAFKIYEFKTDRLTVRRFKDDGHP